MWLTLRENYLLHEATASEKVTYEDFSQIASLCTEKMAERNGGLYQSCICDSSRRGPYINWFSLASAQRICDTFLDLDKDGNSTLDQEELQGYSNGTLTIFLLREVMTKRTNVVGMKHFCGRRFNAYKDYRGFRRPYVSPYLCSLCLSPTSVR
ncbi:unnamed protein product [Lactuca virosa]|uniref:EF-hand domain-containing protein n=1 Tax=Lactuca virosa TaxID=75947 RepID=A0AAU9N7X5_9ASTR|nr:unnamed protein product [Lactuca virosa]